MPKKNQKFLIILVLVAIFAIWYFTRPSSDKTGSSSKIAFPLGIGQSLDKFTSKSKFGEDTSSGSVIESEDTSSGSVIESEDTSSGSVIEEAPQKIITYSDGSKMSSKYSDSGFEIETFPDGTAVPMSSKVFMVIVMVTSLTSLFQSGNVKGDDLTTQMNLMMQTTTLDEFNKFWNNLNKEIKLAFVYIGVANIIMFQGTVMNQIDFCNKNPSTPNCNGFLQYPWLCYNVLNIDLLNKKPKIGNGWDQYTVDATITKDSDVTPSGIKFGKKVKTIMMAVKTSEKTTGDASQIRIIVNGTEYPQGDTTWTDNMSGLNNRIFVVPLESDIILTSLKIMVTCPGSSVTLKSGVLDIVYV